MADTKMRRFTTDELTSGIIRTKDFQRYMRNHENSLDTLSLTDHLEKLLMEKNLRRSEVISRGNIDRAFGFQIFNGTKNPSRDKVLLLAFGFGLDYKETSELLRIARKAALYARLKRDAILIYCLSHHMSIFETQYMLTEAGLSPLGEEHKK